MMKHLCTAGMVFAVFTQPAYSQFNPNASQKEPLQQQYEQRQKEHQETERAYNEMLKRTRGQTPVQTKSDPWASVRPAEPAKTKR